MDFADRRELPFGDRRTFTAAEVGDRLDSHLYAIQSGRRLLAEHTEPLRSVPNSITREEAMGDFILRSWEERSIMMENYYRECSDGRLESLIKEIKFLAKKYDEKDFSPTISDEEFERFLFE